MLEWLKAILGDAYTEEIDRKVSEEIGKGFVAKADFNAVKTDLKNAKEAVTARDGQLEELRRSGADVESLKTQIAALQKQNAESEAAHEAAMKRLRVDSAAERALQTARAKNVRAVKSLLDLDGAELLEDGTVKGLKEQLEKLMGAPDSAFLFEAAKSGAAFRGLKPGESGDAPAGGKTPKDMTYTELCAYLEANPGAQI